MINVLTTNEDKFLLLSSAKIKVQFLSNINVFDRYFVYETLSKLYFDDLLFIWILSVCLSSIYGFRLLHWYLQTFLKKNACKKSLKIPKG